MRSLQLVSLWVSRLCAGHVEHTPQIIRGEGTLSLAVNDHGTVETVGKTLPLLLAAVDVTCYPEGGDLVAGVPSRVYIQALAPSGDPADIHADIVEVGPRVMPPPPPHIHTRTHVNFYPPSEQSQAPVISNLC